MASTVILYIHHTLGVFMESVPKSLRIQLVVVGRINVGKSSIVNLICDQNVAIASEEGGTTTDVVEKTMELRPLGPVLFLDTAGFDDKSKLGTRRLECTMRAINRADIIILVTVPNIWGDIENEIVEIAKKRHVGLVVLINKCDLTSPNFSFLKLIRAKSGSEPLCICAGEKKSERHQLLSMLTTSFLKKLPSDIISPPPLLDDLLPAGSNVILIVPIDLQAPKGRLIMPQMQAIRNALDLGTIVLVVKENQYSDALKNLKSPPALVVCDSQVVDYMEKQTPVQIPCTTFSILFARLKGDLETLAAGAAFIEKLNIGDKVLIVEACTHHPTTDDIGRMKIPRWLQEKVGGPLDINVASGSDYPTNLKDYNLIIHCGGCMLNRREVLRRLELAKLAQVPITNYGMAIAACKKVLERVLAPFPNALSAWKNALK